LRLYKEIRTNALAEFGIDPYRKFERQRQTSRSRGIEFKMGFEDWWKLWEADFANRGRHVGQNVMCRNADMGPYEDGNVRIGTTTSNQKERWLLANLREFAEEWGGNAQASDWLDQRRDMGYL
jgi:hypothetical protein